MLMDGMSLRGLDFYAAAYGCLIDAAFDLQMFLVVWLCLLHILESSAVRV